MSTVSSILLYFLLPVAVGVLANLLTPAVRRRLDMRLSAAAAKSHRSNEQEEELISELAEAESRILILWIVQQILWPGFVVGASLLCSGLLILGGQVLFSSGVSSAWTDALRLAALLVAVAGIATALRLMSISLATTERIRIRRHDCIVLTKVPPEEDPRTRRRKVT